MDIRYRIACSEDLKQIYELVQSAINTMIRQNIFQWDEIYPDKEILREDILKNQLYVGIIENKIAVIYVLNSQCDDEYKNGQWECNNKPFRIIHRLCVDPAFQNKGIGRITMQHIEEEVINTGIEYIRLDAFSENPFALRLYNNYGYSTVGCAHWRKGKFYLMEKHLKK